MPRSTGKQHQRRLNVELFQRIMEPLLKNTRARNATMAYHCGVSDRTIIRWMCGYPVSPGVADRLSEKFNQPINVLFPRKPG